MNAEDTTLRYDTYLDHVVADAERFAQVLDDGDVSAHVAACGDWDVTQLAGHLGFIHRWATAGIRLGDKPEPGTDFDASGPPTGDWMRAGAIELADAARATGPGAATWHPFNFAKVTDVWARRMAHETAVHRWDAEHAVDAETPIDAVLAADGIDEYFEFALPVAVARGKAEPAIGSLHLHCTDVTGEWLVWFDNDGLQVVREHQKGDAALRGPAEAILLKLWGRGSNRAAELDPIGDESVLAAWLALGGN